MREFWDMRGTSQDGPPRSARNRRFPGAQAKAQPACDDWESALGALVVGRIPDTDFGQQLARDPAVALVRGLIHEFRGSMLVGLLRLTSNLLMLSLGIDNFTLVMKDFWLKFPPEPFASDEALAFSGYMADLKLPVPHLAKILEYEIAAVGSLSSGTSHVVKFEFDPIPLLRALSDGRLPDVLGAPGKYEIELDGRRQFGGTGGSLDAVGVAVGGLERSLNHRASSELWAQ